MDFPIKGQVRQRWGKCWSVDVHAATSREGARKRKHDSWEKCLWRDVFDGVLYIYYHLFYHLEDCVTLDPTNQDHLFALHFVFVPRINRYLNLWKAGYVHHWIHTAGSRSPMQLYIFALLRMRGTDLVAAREMYEPRTEVII